MKRTSLVCCLLAVLAVLSGVTLAQDEQIELVIWGEPNVATCIAANDADDPNCAYAWAVYEGWNERYPTVTLKFEDQGWDITLRQNLITAQLAGTEPDIIAGDSFMPGLMARGDFAPLDLPQNVVDSLVPGPLAAVTRNGQYYGVVAFTGTFAFEINADVVRQAGLDPDTIDLSTWDAVTAAAAAISEAGDDDFYGASLLGPTAFPAAALFHAAPYIYQTGAALCDAECLNPTFNDPRAAPVYEWFRELNQYTPPGVTLSGDENFIVTRLFLGATAMQTAGTWYPNWARDTGCTDCRYLPLPRPSADAASVNVAAGNAIYAVLESSAHQEAAANFLGWLASDEVQRHNFWSNDRLPATYSALNSLRAVAEGDTSSVPAYYDGTDPVAESQQYVSYIDALLNSDIRILPPWQKAGPALDQLWNDMFAEILATEAPVQEIMDRYQAAAAAIVAE